ncbi:hypothetical protein L226DRAFT_297676 [Lentinus tigrinus ALCF2SS1-7]|uniref:uncharacterized protein n=1 Tax=Lentinus tigrinus ALCF2SS1-7 TaxID=1328758 RepID=UPI0011662E87|nr:hypothetical protein L226DRAFT_297676 [Lentinus tigrinus ALCF2SS1-7]
MSVTPGKGRMSAIPTPGKSSIPTPGLRPRSTSSAGQRPSVAGQDDDYAARAFQDAIRANDPAQHRGSRTSDISIASSQLSPSSSTSSVFNGARSLSAGIRPSSSASSSSAVSAGRTPSAKAPLTRPPSRTSDVFARSASRAGRGFDVGDNVRIESLGFEGILRYLGEIDGKPGMWAGVELSGGFAGKGKNNGSVAGKQYFTCPPNCGVFVASTKLSAATVGMSRPSSVASVRSGRMTPSFSASGRMTPSALPSMGNGRKTPSISNGRVTPSISNGRVTPSISNGRVTPAASMGRKTPSLQTPSARPRPSASTARGLVTPVRTTNMPTNITPGSRAAKYVGMTAKQLAGTTPGSPKRAAGAMSPTRPTGFGSPVQPPRQLSSPTRNSPFNTPKALGSRPSGIGMGLPTSTTPSKSRPSFSNTPRARIPSAIAMPPPPSPSNTTLSSRSVSLNGPQTPVDAPLMSDLELNNKLISERIAALSSSKTPSSPRPDSRVSTADSAHVLELQTQVERLQARLVASEDENKRLLTRAEGAEREASSRIESLVAERDRNASRVTELETAARTAERTLAERTTQMEALQRAAEQAKNEVEKVRTEGETKLRDVQHKLEDKETLVTQLKEALDERAGEQSNSDAQIKAKNAEIALLESRVTAVSTEFEDARRDLNAHIDELRRAGQEMVALYEERLSVADTKRLRPLQKSTTRCSASRCSTCRSGLPPSKMTSRTPARRTSARRPQCTTASSGTRSGRRRSARSLLKDGRRSTLCASRRRKPVFVSRSSRRLSGRTPLRSRTHERRLKRSETRLLTLRGWLRPPRMPLPTSSTSWLRGRTASVHGSRRRLQSSSTSLRSPRHSRPAVPTCMPLRTSSTRSRKTGRHFNNRSSARRPSLRTSVLSSRSCGLLPTSAPPSWIPSARSSTAKAPSTGMSSRRPLLRPPSMTSPSLGMRSPVSSISCNSCRRRTMRLPSGARCSSPRTSSCSRRRSSSVRSSRFSKKTSSGALRARKR